MQAAIDFGISNIDLVAHVDGALRRMTRPSEGAPSPASIRTLLADAGVELDALDWLAVTGGRHRQLPERIDNCAVIRVGEVDAIGNGGRALAGLPAPAVDQTVVAVSAGSGTAVVAIREQVATHITGSGVGGGTLLGLSRLLLQTAEPGEIDALALRGDPNGADLALRDVISEQIGSLPPDATAVNFGRLAREAISVRREDLAAALVTLVGQVIAVTAITAARAMQTEQIVVIGHLPDMPSVRNVLARVGEFYGATLTVPEDGGYATALGALLWAQRQA